MAGSEKLRARRLRADGAGQSPALPGQHGEEAANRADLPRLSAQRSHGDRGRAAVDPRAARRAGVDASDLGAGEVRPRSGQIHDPHGSDALAQEQGMA